MVKINTCITLDPEVHALVVANIKNLSGFVNESVLAHCGSLSGVKEGIPKEKIMEQQIRALAEERDNVTVERDKFKVQIEQLTAKYNRMVMRTR